MPFMTEEHRITRIKRATAAFDVRIKNLYEPLAQVLTGKRTMKVKPHPTSSMTDGKTIWLRVPLELGDDTEHIKELCGHRDELDQMRCEACRVFDETDGTCFHEIFHIVEESFRKVDARDRLRVVESLIKMKFPDDPYKLDSLTRKLEWARMDEAMSIASALDLWLPLVTNAIEDIFVNAAGFQKRPGTMLPLKAGHRRHLTGRWETPEGWTSWAERDFDSRAMIAVYCLGGGYEYALEGLGDDIKPIVTDERIVSAVKTATMQPSATDRLTLAVEVLGYLREHGACIDSRSELFEKITVVLTDGKPEESEDTDSPDWSDIPEDMEVEVIDLRTEPPEPSDEDGPEDSKSSPTDADDDDDIEDDDETAKGGSPVDDDDDDETKDAGDDDASDRLDGDSIKSDDMIAPESEGEGEKADSPESPEGDHETDGSSSDDATGDRGEDHDDDDDDDDDFDDDDDDFDDDEKGEASKAPDMGEDTEASDKEARELEVNTAKKAAEDLKRAMGHADDDKDESPTYAEREEIELLELWLDQRDFFDDPSYNVRKIKNIERSDRVSETVLERAPGASEINPVLGRLRVAFTENAKVGIQRSLKSGPRLDSAHLYRVALDDPRVFARRSLPRKRDWHVTIGLDCSGSTSGDRIETIKTGGFAMGELLSRLGIPFAMYGHSGDYMRSGKYELTMFHVKNPGDSWDSQAKARCLNLRHHQANLDGHTLEFYRRVSMSERATDRLIMYFTDGAMPAENPAEELQVLQRNIKLCQQQKVRLVAVAVKNEDPKRYGLDTIRYDGLRDLPRLIDELGKRLM